MLVLGIESASDQCGCALAGAEGVVAEARLALPRRHAEALAPQMRFVCEQASVALGDVEAVAVDCGPGLYTGLRAGLATAKATAAALGIGVVPVGSLEALAFGAAALAPPVAGVPAGSGAGARPGTTVGVLGSGAAALAPPVSGVQVGAGAGARPGTTVLSVLDARRGEVFWASYRRGVAPDEDAPGTAADSARESGPAVTVGPAEVGADSGGGASGSAGGAAARAPVAKQKVDAGSGSGVGSTASFAGLVELTAPTVGTPADLRAEIISRSGQASGGRAACDVLLVGDGALPEADPRAESDSVASPAPIVPAAGDILLVGDGALRYADLLAVGRATFAGPELRFPSPAAVALLGRERALAGGAVLPEQVEPLYLRPPDAQPQVQR